MKWSIAFAVLILIACVIGISGCVRHFDEIEIKTWVSQQGETPQTITQPFWNHGPYWNVKGRRIYQVTSSTNREYWFRFGNFFGYDVEEKVGSQYRVLK